MLLITCQPDYLFLFDEQKFINNVYSNFIRPIRIYPYNQKDYIKYLKNNKNVWYWGACNNNKRIFIFHANLPEDPTNNTSKIISYIYKDNELIDEIIEIDDLDFGIHEICIKENKIYILNTYWQNIIIYILDENSNIIKESKSIIEPFKKALSYKYKNFEIFNKYKDDLNEYRHINSIINHNSKWYICCPYVLSLLKDKNLCNKTKYSEIEIFDNNFNYIEKIILPHKGVHSLFFIDDTLLYLSFDFKLIYFDYKNKIVETEIELDIINNENHWCRGISLINNKYIFVGVNNLLQLIDNEKRKILSAYVTKGMICMITKI